MSACSLLIVRCSLQGCHLRVIADESMRPQLDRLARQTAAIKAGQL